MELGLTYEPPVLPSCSVTEKGDSVCEKKGLETDPFLATWDGPNDPKNPMVSTYISNLADLS